MKHPTSHRNRPIHLARRWCRFVGVPLCALAFAAGPIPAQDDEEGDSEFTVIHAARVITVSGLTHAPGTVVIENGKIRLVGRDLEYPKAARVIDARRETVLPGLILARSRYDLLPRYSRAGLRGAQTAATEVYLSDHDFDELLQAGYTAIAYIPNGSGIPGSASVYHTAGDDSSRLLRERAYLRVTMANPASDKAQLRQALEKAKKEIEKVKKAREEWEKKKKEAAKKPPEKSPEKKAPEKKAPETPPKRESPQPKKSEPPKTFQPPKIDPNVQPLVDLIEKKKGAAVMFELSRASDLHHLDSVLRDFPEVSGNYYLRLEVYVDYRHVAEKLGERKALVALSPLISRLPYTVDRINLAADLARAGCKPVFLPRYDAPRGFQYVRTQVAALVRAGLTRKTALEGLALNPARLVGLDDRLGSIEKGKEADLVFLDGDPFEPESRVTRVMIGGDVVWKAKEK